MKRPGRWIIFYPSNDTSYPNRISKLYGEKKYAVLKNLNGDTFENASLWMLTQIRVDPKSWDWTNKNIDKGAAYLLPIWIQCLWDNNLDALYVPLLKNVTDAYKGNPILNAARKVSRKSDDYTFHVEIGRKAY